MQLATVSWKPTALLDFLPMLSNKVHVSSFMFFLGVGVQKQKQMWAFTWSLYIVF